MTSKLVLVTNPRELVFRKLHAYLFSGAGCGWR